LITPTNTPEEIAETPSPEPVVQSGNSNIKNIAIALLASGVVILGAVLIGTKIKSKRDTPIPPIYPPQNPPTVPPINPPTMPPIVPPTIPPTEGSQLI
jgi:hypothetical protein